MLPLALFDGLLRLRLFQLSTDDHQRLIPTHMCSTRSRSRMSLRAVVRTSRSVRRLLVLMTCFDGGCALLLGLCSMSLSHGGVVHSDNALWWIARSLSFTSHSCCPRARRSLTARSWSSPRRIPFSLDPTSMRVGNRNDDDQAS